MIFSGVMVTVNSSPAGTPVSGSATTFDYPILSSVTLICNVAADDGLPVTVDSYRWNTAGCYTHPNRNNGNSTCFPDGQTTQSVTDNDVTAEDAGTITCTVTISGIDYTSGPFTLRISGEELVYCVIACIVYCKQCMLLLLATCYCCIIHQLLWFMYRGVFTVGIALIKVMVSDDAVDNTIVSANAITEYSYVNNRGDNRGRLTRCATGLGPNATHNNRALGEVYFNGNRIPDVGCRDSSSPIVRLQSPFVSNVVGVINIVQCRTFSTAAEGIYTCIMMNSSMMSESIRFGVYFTGRSKSSINLHSSLLKYLASLYTAAPIIDNPSLSTVKVAVGSPLILNCTSRGSPPDTFTWRKDNDPTILQSTSITAVDHTNTSAVFRADYSIDSVTTSDSGTYTCTVTNPIGSDSTAITVLICKLLIRITCIVLCISDGIY